MDFIACAQKLSKTLKAVVLSSQWTFKEYCGDTFPVESNCVGVGLMRVQLPIEQVVALQAELCRVLPSGGAVLRTCIAGNAWTLELRLYNMAKVFGDSMLADWLSSSESFLDDSDEKEFDADCFQLELEASEILLTQCLTGVVQLQAMRDENNPAYLGLGHIDTREKADEMVEILLNEMHCFHSAMVISNEDRTEGITSGWTTVLHQRQR